MPSHRWRTADKTSPAAKQRARDYASPTHRALRKRYQRDIDNGNGWCHEIVCVMATRHIPPGTRWHLAHTPHRTGYLGSAHEPCNLRAAAKAGNQAQRARQRRRAQSRAW